MIATLEPTGLEILERVARWMRSRHPMVPLGDLVSWGYPGLEAASRSWRPGRGTTFETFAHHRIRGAILDGIRVWSGIRTRRVIWLWPPAWGLGNRSRKGPRARRRFYKPMTSERLECFPARATATDRLATCEEIVEASLGLTDRDWRIVLETIGFGQSLRRVGCQMGITESRACQIRARALAHMRRRAIRG